MLNVNYLAHGDSLVECDFEQVVMKCPECILSLICSVELPDIFAAIFLEHAVKCEDISHDVFSRLDGVVELLLHLEHLDPLLEVSKCSWNLRTYVESWSLATLPDSG